MILWNTENNVVSVMAGGEIIHAAHVEVEQIEFDMVSINNLYYEIRGHFNDKVYILKKIKPKEQFMHNWYRNFLNERDEKLNRISLIPRVPQVQPQLDAMAIQELESMRDN